MKFSTCTACLVVLVCLLGLCTAAPAQLVIVPQSTEDVRPGSTIVMTCVSIGDPLTPLSWKRGDDIITNDTPGVTISTSIISYGGTNFTREDLEICNVSVAYDGEYSCTAYNTNGSDTSTWNVTTLIPPEVLIVPDSGEIEYNSSVIMTCVASGVPRPQIRWERDGLGLTSDISETVVVENGVVFVESFLEVCSFKNGDAGLYGCQATNTAGGTELHQWQLELGVATQVLITTEASPVVPTSSTAMFVCVVTGNPLPIVEWHYEGNPLTNSSRIQLYTEVVMVTGREVVQSVLEICSLNQSDPGLYECMGRNHVGTDSAALNLTVVDIRAAQVILHSDSVSTVPESSTTFLVCVATGYPSPQITWLKNGSQLTNVTHNVTLYVTDVEERGVSGVQAVLEVCGVSGEEVYQCVARNSAGEDSVTFDLIGEEQTVAQVLITTEASPIIPTGSTAMFVCVVTGNPLPIVEWHYEGNLLTNSSRIQLYTEVVMVTGREVVQSVLEICSLNQSDPGLYECMGRNHVGTDSAALNLTVVDIRAAQVILHSDSVSTVPESSTTFLVCVATGYPSPQITWLKNGSQLTNVTHNVTLYVTDVEERGVSGVQAVLEVCGVSGEEVYQCVAKNSAGEDSVTFDLIGEEQTVAQVLITTEASPIIPTGSTAMFVCVVTGNPLPIVEWHYEGNLLTNSSRIQLYTEVVMVTGREVVQSVLEICSLNQSDPGLYECMGRNHVGTDSAAVNLTVVDIRAAQVILHSDSVSTVPESSTTFLVCVATGYPSPQITWLKNGSQLTNVTDNVTLYMTDVEERGVSGVQAVLEVCGVSGEEVYQCVARNSAGEDSVTFDLIGEEQTDAQVLITTEASPIIPTGSTAMFVCVVTGNPLPILEWHYEGNPLTNSSRIQLYTEVVMVTGREVVQSVLEICSLNQSDPGLYECMGRNHVGTDSAAVNLTVVDIRAAQVILHSDSVSTVPESSTTFLVCVATGYPSPQITWLKNGSQLTNVTDNVTLYMTDVEESGVSGVQAVLEVCGVSGEEVFQCVARNSAGEDSVTFDLIGVKQTAAQVLITTEDSPIIPTGSTAMFVCVVTGNPLPIVEWHYEGNLLTNSSRIQLYTEVVMVTSGEVVQSVLEICSLNQSDSGLYECMGRNHVGTDSAAVNLTVVDIRAAQVILHSDSVSTVPESSTTFLVCVATGYPSPQITWLKNGSQLTNVTDNVTLYVTDVEERGVSGVQAVLEVCGVSGEEVYQCVAKNSAGEDSVTFDLIRVKQTAAQVLITTEASPVVPTGSTAMFVCVVTGNPLPFVEWHYEGNLLTNSSRIQLYTEVVMVTSGEVVQSVLEICSLNQSDPGLYECIGRNHVGTDSAAVNLTVSLPPVAKVVIASANTTLKGQSSTLFTCVGYGSSSPVVTWIKEGEVIKNDTVDGRISVFEQIDVIDGRSFVYSYLEVCGVGNGDSGEYVCRVESEGATDQQTFTVDISTAAEPPKILISPDQTINVDEGSTLIFTCVATDDLTQMTWVKGGADPLSNGSRYRIISEQLQEGVVYSTLEVCGVGVTDTGVYTCVASNTRGNDSMKFELRVVEKATILLKPANTEVNAGDTVVLSCTAKGAYPVFSWLLEGVAVNNSKDHVTIQNSNITVNGATFLQSTLTICSALPSDIGTYTCELASQNTTDNAQFSLSVTSKPASLVVIPPPVIHARPLTSILLTCVTSGYPLPSITWTREGQSVVGGSETVSTSVIDVNGRSYVQSTLLLCQQEVGVGSLNCMASNGISGDDVVSATVTVNVSGNCLRESQSLISSGVDRGELVWEETEFNATAVAMCPCSSMDLHHTATRMCSGDGRVGGMWEEPVTDECDLSELGWILCDGGSGEVAVVSELTFDSGMISPSEVALVTGLIESLLNTSLGNATASDILLILIDNLLKGSEKNFLDSQEEFNTTGRLMAVLDLIADNYPLPSNSTPHSITLDTFSMLIYPFIDTQAFPGHSVYVSSQGQLGSDQSSSASIQIPSSLFDQLSTTQDTRMSYMAFKNRRLFVRRPSYLESKNRTSYRVGSVVLSARVSGDLKVTGLREPVTMSFNKDKLLSNGSVTGCSYWDQLLDEGYGGWSTKGCRLSAETDEKAVCLCDHLTSFTIVIDAAPSAPPPAAEASIARYTSIGSVAVLICVLVVFISYLVSSLRSSPTGIFLLNLCLSLLITFSLAIISQYLTESPAACVLFAALFHYSILVSTMSIACLAFSMVYTPYTGLKKKVFYTSTIVANWVLPVVIVVLSLAPDYTKYMGSDFCRPVERPFWFGLLLPAIICMFLIAVVLVIIPVVKRRAVAKGSHDPWLREYSGLLLIAILYFVAWGFGLPAMQPIGSNAARVLFQAIYIIASILLGVVFVLFFVAFSKHVRNCWMTLTRRFNRQEAINIYNVSAATESEQEDKENLYTDLPGKGVPLSILEMEERNPPPETFVPNSSVGVDADLTFRNPRTSESETVEKTDLSRESVGADDVTGEGVECVDANVYLDFPSTFTVVDGEDGDHDKLTKL